MRLWTNQVVRLLDRLRCHVRHGAVPPGFPKALDAVGLSRRYRAPRTRTAWPATSARARDAGSTSGIRFQPSEIMKLAVPMMAAWYLHDRQIPPSIPRPGGARCDYRRADRPDCAPAGPRYLALSSPRPAIIVVVLAGLPIRLMVGLAIAAVPGALILWNFMQDYQKQRVLTLTEPRQRSARCRLQHHPVKNRHRLGRPVRQRLDERQPGAARVSARARHGLYFRRDRRGARPARRADAARCCTCSWSAAACTLPRSAHDTFSRLLAGSISLTFFVLCLCEYRNGVRAWFRWSAYRCRSSVSAAPPW